jgi:hypothetical protein
MKKENVFLVVALIAMVYMTSCGIKKSASSDPDGNVGTENVFEAETKARIKGWEAEGYKLMENSTFTWERALKIHNAKILSDTEKFIPIMGEASAEELSSAKMLATNDAALQCAQIAIMAVGIGFMAQADNLFGDAKTGIAPDFIQNVASYIVPYMKESFGMRKSNGKDVEVHIFYTVGEEDMITIGKRVLERVIEERVIERLLEEMDDTRSIIKKALEETKVEFGKDLEKKIEDWGKEILK